MLGGVGAMALLGGVSTALNSTSRKDSNVYLDELFFEGQELPKLEMLAIHSGQLDEALTLLSAAPAVDAVSDSVIDEMARGLIGARPKNPHAQDTRAGERQPLWGALVSLVGALGFFVVQILYLVFPFVERGLRRRIKTRLKGLVLRVFEAEAMGLTAHEFKNCRIDVSEKLELDLELGSILRSPSAVDRGSQDNPASP